MNGSKRAIPVLLAFCLIEASLCAAGTPDYWAQQNKDGHWRNSSDNSLTGTPRVRWAQALRGFYPNQAFPTWGNRSNNLSIRNGQILSMVPPPTPVPPQMVAPGNMGFASFGVFSLANGQLLNTAVSPHIGGGAMMTHPNGGFMDSDTAYGLINQYWRTDGTVFTAHGSDQGWSAQFNAYTGETPFGLPKIFLNGGINGSGYFAMSNTNPLVYATGGGSAHSPWDTGRAGLIGVGENVIQCLKCYCSHAVDGEWVYALYATELQSGWGLGVTINASRLQASAFTTAPQWTYSDPDKMFLGFGMDHCMGSPRAYCLGEDGRLYYFGFNTSGSGDARYPDWSRGLILVGIPTAGSGNTRTSDLTINSGWDPSIEAQVPIWDDQTIKWYLTHSLHQIATRNHFVVVFVPEQGDGRDQNSTYVASTNAHLFCFDTTAGTMLWRKDFSAGTFTTKTTWRSTPANSGDFVGNANEAVQMTLAGDSAYVVEPLVNGGTLQLRVDRFILSSGAQSTTILTPQANGAPIAVQDPGVLALREIAAVDGTLTCLIDFDQLNQALVVIEGDASTPIDYVPVAVISAPTTGKLEVQPVVSDWPTAPTNQYDSGAVIPFSSLGSADPNGGALTYAWDFGDGITSTQANPSHVYVSSGQMLSIVQRTITLTVRDSTGNFSAPATRVLAIRNVGSLQHTALSAVADSYVDPANAGANFGTDGAMSTDYHGKRAYIRFDLTGVDTTSVISAVLRVVSPDRTTNSLFRVYDCSPGWNETTINYSNAPAPGQLINEMQLDKFMAPLAWCNLDFNVTADVRNRAGGAVSFVLDSTQTGWLNMITREGGHAPQLLLISGATGYTAPTFITQPPDTVVEEMFSMPMSALAHSSNPLGDGELSYHWETVSAPVGGALSFQPNHSNQAKNTIVVATNGLFGTYTVRCVAADSLGQTATSRTASIAISQFANPLINVNFQPAGTPTPAGFVADTGSVYGDRGNGWQYGWTSDHSSMARFRNSGLPLELDTLIGFQSGALWEIGIANGTYKVAISIGDAAGDSTDTLNVESVNFWNALYLNANEFRTLMRTVTVTDGRLTLDVGAAPTWGTRIDYIKIAPATGGNNPPVITSGPAATPNPAAVGQSVVFLVSASDPDGDPLTYSWNFGDGGSATGTAPGHTYTAAGNYTATVTVSDGRGGTVSGSVIVVVNSVTPAPVITSAPTATGTVGTVFNYAITATNSPTSFNATPLPAGLSINTATGVISGTPTAAGTTNVTISATNAGGTGSATLTLTINTATTFTLTVNTAGTGSGSVALNPPGGVYSPGTVVTLTATPAASSTFSGWSGDLSGSVNPATITMNANKIVTATFSIRTYTVTASAGANGTVAPAGSVSVNYGAAQTFAITPNAGYAIASVTVDGASAGTVSSYTFSNVTANHTISATFSAVTTPPAAPSNLTAAAVSSTQINLAWADNSNNETGFKIERSVGTGNPFSLKLDFNSGNSPAAAGFTAFPVQAYTAAVGYGWQSTANIDSRDRASGGDLYRDFHFSNSDGIFLVDVPNGAYTVTMYFGDASSGHDLIDVYAEGALKLQGITTAVGQFISQNFNVTVADGQLTLRVHDNGGSDANWVVNGLEVLGAGAPVWTEIATTGANVSSYADTGLAAGTAYSYRVRAYNANGLSGYSNIVTAATAQSNPPPVITSALTATGMVGQAFSYSIAATNSPASYNATGLPAGLAVNTATGVISGIPVLTGTSNVTISATNSGGTASATLVIAVNTTNPFSLKLDFNNGNSPTAAGFIGFPLQNYNAGVGFGWQDIAGMETRDRGAGGDLYRDFHFSNIDRTFLVDVPNGNCTVTMYFGDVAAPHDLVDVYAEGALTLQGITTGAGQFMSRSFNATVSDGQLTLRLHDNGGSDANWVVNGLEVLASGGASIALAQTVAPGAIDLGTVVVNKKVSIVLPSSQNFNERSRASDFHWKFSRTNSLPRGFNLTGKGILKCKPKVPGTYNFQVQRSSKGASSKNGALFNNTILNFRLTVVDKM